MKKLSLSSLLLFVLGFSFAQIPNSGFELWDNQPVPLQWETNSRPLTLPPWDPYIVKQDTERYAGNYAANFYANGVFKAFATTTFPITAHPLSLSLYYKLSFAPCVNDPGFPQRDTVSVLVEVLNGNTVVDAGYWEKTSTSFNYSQLVIPVSQNATVFDSCRITIYGGKIYGGCGIIAAHTEFKVDELELQYAAATCTDTGVVVQGVECLLIYDFQTSSLFMPCSLPVGATLQLGDTIAYDYTLTSCISICQQGTDVEITCFQNLSDDTATGCINPSQICPSCPCPAVYDPVCGCDGNTYGNFCEAQNAGVTSWTTGACTPTNDSCIYTGVVVEGVECLLVADFQTGSLLMPCSLPVGAILHLGDTVTYNYTAANCASVCQQGVYVDFTCFEIVSTGDTSQPCSTSVALAVTHPTSHVAANGHIIATVSGATPPVIFVWNPGGGSTDSIGGLSNGTYCVTVTDSSGCTAAACATLNGPNICIDSALICEPGSLCCDAPLFQPVCGCDSVTYMNACVATLLAGVTSMYEGECVTTGIRNAPSLQGVYLFPNPANDVLQVRYETVRPGKTEMRITNLLGQEVVWLTRAFEVSGSHTAELNVSSLSAGVYIFEIKTESGRRVRKFTVE